MPVTPARSALAGLVAGAFLFVVVLLALGTGWEGRLGLAFVALLVPVALIDLEHRIIPNRLLGPGAVAAVAIVALGDPSALPERLVAGVAAGGFLLLAALARPSGMGMGDVKLAAVMGLFLGRDVGPAMLVALVAGTLVGAAIMLRKGVHEARGTAVPFGPFLAVGGVAGLLAGPESIEWYATTFG